MPESIDAPRLSLTSSEMRRLADHVVALVIERFDTKSDSPIGKRPTKAELEGLFAEPLPAKDDDPMRLIDQAVEQAFGNTIRVDHARYFAFVPAPNNFVGAMADALCAGFNAFAGTWMVGAGAAQVELTVMEWLRQIVGMPDGAGGLLVSGGSMANLTALVAAREAVLGEDFGHGAVYLSDQTHSSAIRALKVAGFAQRQIRVLPSDKSFRLPFSALQAAVSEDRAAGLCPFCAILNAGTTNTGAVDDFETIVPWARSEGLWIHADAAYGGLAAVSPNQKPKLAGLGEVDSMAIDPHKWLYAPIECGGVLMRDFSLLKRAFKILPDYLLDKERDAGEVDFCDHGIQLSRSFRAFKVWLMLKTFGVEAFAESVDHNVRLAEVAGERLVAKGFELAAPPSLGIVAFWHPEADSAAHRRAVDCLIEDGFAMASSTQLKGRTALRMCTLSPLATKEDVEQTVDKLAQFVLASRSH